MQSFTWACTVQCWFLSSFVPNCCNFAENLLANYFSTAALLCQIKFHPAAGHQKIAVWNRRRSRDKCCSYMPLWRNWAVWYPALGRLTRSHLTRQSAEHGSCTCPVRALTLHSCLSFSALCVASNHDSSKRRLPHRHHHALVNVYVHVVFWFAPLEGKKSPVTTQKKPIKL